jgi:CRISP-associated protein Cas1
MKEHDVPVMPLKSRLSVFTVERGHIEREGSALSVMDKNGVRAQFPVGATAVLMLEPGTTISHAAVKLCAESRALIIWVGEGGVRLYSAGQEGSAHTYRLLRQAKLALDPKTRLAVAREMYRIRFREEAPMRRSIEQLRGMEGARVRARYKELSKEYGVRWEGRNYNRTNWSASDTINRAVSAGNSCLYGLCHAAILISGYSAAIGFIHTGYPLAFVHDLADIWKMDLSVPVAFRIVAESEDNVATRVRHALRNEFRTTGFLEKIIPSIESLLDAGTPGVALPEELGGARIEPTSPEDAPWYGQGGGIPQDTAHTSTTSGPPSTEGTEEEYHIEIVNNRHRSADDPLGLLEGFGGHQSEPTGRRGE